MLLLKKVSLILAILSVSIAFSDELKRYKGTIIISTNGNPNRIAGYKSLIKAYQKYQPEVNVLIEVKGGGKGAGYNTWLTTQLASGNPRPDIVSGSYSPDYHSYVNFDYYRELKNPYTKRQWEKDIDFDWNITRNGRGERYMLASQSVHVLWVYNKDIFNKYGLSEPKTWKDFIDICETLQNKKIISTTLSFNFRFYQWVAEILWDQYSRKDINLVRAQPGDWCYNPKVDKNWKYNPQDPFNDCMPTFNQARLLKSIRDGEIRYDTPAFKTFLNNLKILSKYTSKSFFNGNAGGSEPYALFLSQKAAMHLDGTWVFPQLKEDLRELNERKKKGKQHGLRPFAWGTFEMPSQNNRFVQAPARSIESASGIILSVIEKNQFQTDMVMDFVMFWFSPPGYQAFVDGEIQSEQFNPSGKIMINDIHIPKKYEYSVKAKLTGNAEYISFVPFVFTPQGTRLAEDARQVLVGFIKGRINVDQAANKLQEISLQAVTKRMEAYGIEKKFIDQPELNPGQ